MPAASFGPLNTMDSRDLLIPTSRCFGKSVRERWLDSGTHYTYPSNLHLLYIALDTESKLTVRHLKTAQVTKDNVGTKEKMLFDAGRAHVATNASTPMPESRDFETIVFTKPAVFAIVIDEVGWEFYYPAHANPDGPFKDQTHDPVVFIDAKTTIESSNASGSQLDVRIQTFKENHAFLDAQKVSIVRDAVGSDPAYNMDAVRMLNYFTDKNGQILQEHVHYGFEIYLRALFSAPGAPEHRTTIIIDPDGQNQGPPV